MQVTPFSAAATLGFAPTDDPTTTSRILLESIQATATATALRTAVSAGWWATLPAATRAATWSDFTVWVDPMDGTKEFLLNNGPGVTVLIGIAFRGRPVAGIVHQPFGVQGPRTLVGTGIDREDESVPRDDVGLPL